MKHIRPLLLACVGLLCTPLLGSIQAQEQPNLVVMNLAAHPDDEDGATLTYFRHAQNALAYSVIYTRGEGGQNEIGPELYEELGAIRTQETERAARELGTQVYFLNYFDFGYSKTASEAFEKWGGRDQVTSRLVYLIRKLKPDLLFTNHDTVTVGPRRQHGQHQAVGISAFDAFSLAANPEYHPEQLDDTGVDLWQPSWLYLRQWRNADGGEVSVPIGTVEASVGKSYAAIAADALHFHASQGMDRFAQRLRGYEENRFTLLQSAKEGTQEDMAILHQKVTNNDATPDLPHLIDAGRLPTLAPGTLSLSDSIVVAGQSLQLYWKKDQLPGKNLDWTFYGPIDTTISLTAERPSSLVLTVSDDARPTIPKKKYQYDRYLNHAPVAFAIRDADSGEVMAAGYLPLEIAPTLLLEPTESVVRLRPGLNSFPMQTQVFDLETNQVTVNVAVSRDDDRTVIFQDVVQIELDYSESSVDSLQLLLPQDLQPGPYTITLIGLPRPTRQGVTVAQVQIPGQVFTVKTVPGLKVGVVESYDNTLRRALDELGISYALLDSAALATSSFDDLHTILIDIRAYLTRQDLRVHNDRLLSWVHEGGHLVVNYHKTIEWNPQSSDPFDRSENNPAFAPYPLELSRARVTREEAPVAIQQPDHHFFHRPNEIGPDAWENWIQERGLYFPTTYDEQYEELFCLNDPGEDPHCGSTLLAHYGQGTYLYTALVWYRQLKVFHPGAYATFTNLISLPLVDGRTSSATQ